MSDKNIKIIRELESALKWVDKDDNPNGSIAVKIWCVRDVLKIIKEQEAKKPIYNEEKYGDYLPHCSSCEKVLPNRSQYGDAKFCHICGKAVKWDEHNDVNQTGMV